VSISGRPLYDLLFFCTRKLVKCPGEREIRIFKLLSKYIKDPLLLSKYIKDPLLATKFVATKFVDILVPFIRKRAKNCGKNLS
jgi:U3 small nucleolar RNA-associated protein 20